MPNYPPHRPRCKGHDYYDRGIYLITIVVKNRDHLLGELNMDIKNPGVNLTPLGAAVLEEWEKTPEIQLGHNRHVRILATCVMPDHFHGVLFVEERMDVSVGQVIWGFKASCARRWLAIQDSQQPNTAAPDNKTAPDSQQPNTVATDNKTAPDLCSPSQPCLAAPTPTDAPIPTKPDLHRLSKAQRARYYATLPRTQQPLFDDNYDDSFLWSRGQLDAMINYVQDNPRRAIIQRLYPQYMERRLKLVINGVRYSAWGNMLLLRVPTKEQVFCHRWARIVQLSDAERQRLGYTAPPYHPDTKSRLRYIHSEAWQHDREAGINDAKEGVVLVTPGISPGELEMKNIALSQRLPLIHLQDEPITEKPEMSRFNACAAGSLLILAPWPEDLNAMPSQIGAHEVTAYDRFHNMNLLAQQISQMDTTTMQMTFRIYEEGEDMRGDKMP